MTTPLLADSLKATTLTSTRRILWLVLAVGEMLLISFLFDFTDFTAGLATTHNPVPYVSRLVRWAVITLPIFLLLIWPQRHVLAGQWSLLEARHDPIRALAIHLPLYAILVSASTIVAAQSLAYGPPGWVTLSALGALFLSVVLSLLRILVPISRLLSIVWQWRGSVFGAAAAGLLIVVLADAAILLWPDLAEATLVLSAAILGLYETDLAIDASARSVRVGNFTAIIADTCSGYEGLALVTGFVTVYLAVFRAQLRFPAAFVLYPIGIAASWLLNSVRIAALTSIGAHVSPEVAVKGFHSQAGWIAFLALTLGLMSLSRRAGLFRDQSAAYPSSATGSVRYQATTTYLLPFVALMVGSIVMATLAPHGQPFYLLKAGAVAAALWFVATRQTDWWRVRISPMPVAAGCLVGTAWIATSDAVPSGAALGLWLASANQTLVIIWLIVRGVGTVLLVPIAEELAFRGYLYRRIISQDFHLVSPGTLSWAALGVSSILFGILHDRPVAGVCAGVVFGLVMVRSKCITAAIVCHAVANALIFAWALAWQQWSLL